MRTLVWFRGKELRVADHAPLAEAASAGETIPVFVLDPYFFAPERAQRIPHRIQFLLESLAELEASIAKLGSRLVIVDGKSTEVIPDLARLLAVDRVVAHRWTEPIGKERDRRIAEAIAPIPFDLYEGETLATPGQVLTGSGTPFSVFTPFARAFARTIEISRPRKAPRSLPPLPKLPRAVRLREVPIPTPADLGITPNERILRGGETAAKARLRAFLRGPGKHYDVGRDLMGEAGTSRLSQDLKFGTLSARTVWTQTGTARSNIRRRAARTSASSCGANSRTTCSATVLACSQSRSSPHGSASPGAGMRGAGAHGSAARPAIPSSTRRRGSSSAKASSTPAHE